MFYMIEFDSNVMFLPFEMTESTAFVKTLIHNGMYRSRYISTSITQKAVFERSPFGLPKISIVSDADILLCDSEKIAELEKQRDDIRFEKDRLADVEAPSDCEAV